MFFANVYVFPVPESKNQNSLEEEVEFIYKLQYSIYRILNHTFRHWTPAHIAQFLLRVTILENVTLRPL